MDSLRTLTYRNHEIVVVDNASSDDSLKVLGEFTSVKVVRSDTNRGFAGGNNLGIQQCVGEFVLLLNNDTIVPPDFLDPLCHYLEAHPKVGAVQGKMVLPRHANTLDVCGSFITAFGLPYHYGYYKQDGPKYQRSYPVFSGKGACLMFQRELLAKVGGFLFDEDFFCYYEESDFCHRLWLAGYEVHFVPGPPVKHYMGSTAGGPQEVFVLRHYLRNMAFSLASNLSFLSRLQILPLFFGTILASLGASLLRGKWAVAKAHWGAITNCFRSFGKIRARRRLIKGFRKSSDREIFTQVRRTPRIEYFLKTFTGKLDQYEDIELP